MSASYVIPSYLSWSMGVLNGLGTYVIDFSFYSHSQFVNSIAIDRKFCVEAVAPAPAAPALWTSMAIQTKLPRESAMMGLQATDEGIVSMPLSTSLSLSSYSPPPLEVLVEHVAPFLDRDTFNSLMRVSRTARMTLETKIPPWPAKLASRDHMCRIRCLIFSQDGTNLACGCTDGMIRIWDVWTGEQTPLQDWPGQAVVALAYSPNERILASASNGHTIKIWPLAVRHTTVAVTNDVIGRCCTGKQSSVMSSGTPRNIHAGHVTCLVVSHDGSKLYSGHHHTELISVWDTSTGKCLKEIRGASSDPMPCLRTSQDGRYLVTTSPRKDSRSGV